MRSEKRPALSPDEILPASFPQGNTRVIAQCALIMVRNHGIKSEACVVLIQVSKEVPTEVGAGFKRGQETAKG